VKRATGIAKAAARTTALTAAAPIASARTEAYAGPTVPGPALAPVPAAEPQSPETDAVDAVLAHLQAVAPAVESLCAQAGQLAHWGTELAGRLLAGGRLLAAGNGGSAAEAQHLTAELVGRFDGERQAFSAISLHAETSAVTAIANDYGYDHLFARQVLGHGRAGDVLILLTTSGKSENLLRAAEAARSIGMTSWALTGSAPNPLTRLCDDYVAVEALPANVQEGHLMALHAICRAFDAEVARHGRDDGGPGKSGTTGTPGGPLRGGRP
jgi:D-sedoheptulose 7-phosphate isomerase